MTRILVVEDESAIAEFVAMNLKHAGFKVELSREGSEAQAAIDRVLPQLVLLDWSLPGENGDVLLRRWRDAPRTRELAVILLTARADEADKVLGLDAGADDYLTKPFSTKELLARIRALLRRRSPDALDDIVEFGALSLDPSTHRLLSKGLEVKLGPTEFKLLRFLMTHPERVHSRLVLLDRVWGDHVFIRERTVDVHVNRLRETLSQVDCQSIIETVRGAGYRLALPKSIG